MSIDALMQVMKPPAKPDETGEPERWAFVEKMVGLPLPDDYKAFITTYGTGIIGDFMRIWNPFAKNNYLNLLVQLRDRGDIGFEALPYPIHPKTPGLLAFGSTVNGDTLCWLTNGEPNQWTMFFFEARGPRYAQYAMGLMAYLTSLINKTIRGRVISVNAINRKRLFEKTDD